MSQLQVDRINDASGGVLSPISSIMRNRLINGQMTISQRNGTSSITPTDGQYTLDRWLAETAQSSKFSVQQNAGSVTPPTGFINYLGVTSLSAYTPVSTDYMWLSQRIEGFNIADLGWGTANAKTVTVSFWVRSSLTGAFGSSLSNSAASRVYPFNYNISSANTWEYKTVTIAGDTSGTWNTSNGNGIMMQFNLGTGSNRLGTSSAWGSTDFRGGLTGATAVVGTNGATFYITGVQFEVGTQATSFEYRQYTTELQLCQRYFLKYSNSAFGTYCVGFGESDGNNTTYQITYPVQMRTEATVVMSGTNRILPAAGSLSNNTIPYAQLGVYGGYFGVNTSGVTYGNCYLLGPSNDTTAFLSFSAEL
jgi:hypothetical protein